MSEVPKLDYIHLKGASSSKNLLILVHGRGGRAELMRWMSKRLSLEETDFVLLQAPHPEFVPEMKTPGFSWFYWPDGKKIDESRSAIRNFLSELFEAGYRPENCFWLGFSQGGVMGIDTALRAPFVLGGVICVSGFAWQVEEYPKAFSPLARQQRIICTHGKRDEIVPFDRAKRSYDDLIQKGVSIEFREYSKPHSFELKTEIPELEKSLRNWIAKR